VSFGGVKNRLRTSCKMPLSGRAMYFALVINVCDRERGRRITRGVSTEGGPANAGETG